ncbi:hypothetical protein Ahia01_000026600 [Argonauta hians]
MIKFPDYFPENSTSIDLRRNRIKCIPPNSLDYLKLLEILLLDFNILERLHPDTFQGLWSLKYLSLKCNNLAINYNSFPQDLFRNLSKLTVLTLQGNKHTNGPNNIAKTISRLTALEYLGMTGRSKTSFGREYLQLTKLKHISFYSKRKRSQIYKIAPVTFRNVPHLVKLDLRLCSIKKISTQAFVRLKKLTHLYMSQNKIRDFYVAIFRNFKHTKYLKYLGLNEMNIVDISKKGTSLKAVEAVFLNYTSLRTFEFNNNRLEYIEEDFFANLPKTLEYIYLKNNLLHYGKYLFQIKTLSNIKLIDISMTLSHAHFPLLRKTVFRRHFTHSFTFPKSLKTLLLQGCHYEFAMPPFHFRDANSIRLINATNNLLCPWIGPIRGLENLQILDLSNNRCDNVSNEFFTYFSGLRVLKVENNVFGISDQVKQEGFSKTFLNLTSIEQLYLSNNHIEYLSNNSLLSLKRLQILSLRNNLLKTFNVNISHMFNLSYIDLSENFLTDLPENVFKSIETLSENHSITINMERNTLKCGCHQSSFLKWLNKVRCSSRLKIMYDKCTHPNGTVWTLSDRQLSFIITYLNHSCSSYIGIIIATTSLIMFLGVFFVGTLIYHFRWKLRYLYYMIRERYSYQRMQMDDYLYDAFVSYAEEDRVCVFDYLVPELEEKDNFKLNIHHRDFPAGKQISENILSAIQSSRKCLILLSRNFLASEWCMFEYNMAKMECVHSERDLVVVIMLEELTENELPLQLQHQVKTHSYTLLPSEMEITNDTFWNNLKISLRADK